MLDETLKTDDRAEIKTANRVAGITRSPQSVHCSTTKVTTVAQIISQIDAVLSLLTQVLSLLTQTYWNLGQRLISLSTLSDTLIYLTLISGRQTHPNIHLWDIRTHGLHIHLDDNGQRLFEHRSDTHKAIWTTGCGERRFRRHQFLDDKTYFGGIDKLWRSNQKSRRQISMINASPE